ncbi:MAG: ubiquinol-cytochrome c reductase iron-sulfur subunit [Nitrospirae bacterium]|nr:ubiquinol-cytochrome c reductase iron-sulfur subunit [Nitrospirota bacterium]
MTTDIHNTDITRRSFLKIIGIGSFFISLGISAIAAVRFFFPRVLFEAPSVFKIGKPDEFLSEDKTTEVQVYEMWKKEHAVWIVREKNRLYAIQAKCTHLGCTPNWFSDDKVFKCPCHGSRYHADGVNFAGPAPRPLDRLGISIDDNKVISIDKSRTYTFKDFDKPGVYIEV